jgi:hypothetical protein
MGLRTDMRISDYEEIPKINRRHNTSLHRTLSELGLIDGAGEENELARETAVAALAEELEKARDGGTSPSHAPDAETEDAAERS